MVSAKEIVVKPVAAREANGFVRSHHYSQRVAQNSQVHLGAYLFGQLLGVMQFGPAMDKRKAAGIVSGSGMNGFLELNRLAFSDELPRNSESRCIAVACRMIQRFAPRVEWILSYADGTQCGDGAIYRASGFVLTQIKKNSEILRLPDGRTVGAKTLNDAIGPDGRVLSAHTKEQGAVPLEGFMLRYIKFLTPEARARYDGPVLPFSAIAERGARMYRGQRVGSIDGDALIIPDESEGGSTPTPTLQSEAEAR